jgi:hypothetical protein
MADIIFFCQAPADIVHILKEYDNLKTRYKDNLQIEIVCVNTKVLLDYFNNVKLEDVVVVYLEYIPISIRKIWKLWNWRKKSLKSIKELGLLNGNKTFYFCSIYDDPITSYFMYLLYKQNKEIIYLNHYDDKQNITVIKRKNIKQTIYEYLFYLVTGIKYEYRNMSGRWCPIRFPIESVDYQIKYPVLDDTICKKYAYQIYSNDYDRTVMFFSQPNREKNFLDDKEYDDIHVHVVLKLKELGYRIYTKGHPRLGICKSIKHLVDEEIPSFIPSELLDISKFKFCIGFVTIALASSAKLGIPTYSFLPLVKKHNINYEELLKFSIISGENKIKFIDSLEELGIVQK